MRRRSGHVHGRLPGARHDRCALGSGIAAAALAVVLAACAGCTSGGSTTAATHASGGSYRAGCGGRRGCAAAAGLRQHDPPGPAVGRGDQDRVRPRLRRGLRHGRPHRDQRARGRHRHLLPGPPGRLGEPAAGQADRQLPAGRPGRDPGHRGGAPGASAFRRLLQTAGRRHRAGHGQPAGPGQQRHRRDHLGGRPDRLRAAREPDRPARPCPT